jgi:large subunit ribosomal protein L24
VSFGRQRRRKRHRKPTQAEPAGRHRSFEAPMHISKVAIADPKDGKPTRVRFETKDGKKVRVAVKSGERSMADAKYTRV